MSFLPGLMQNAGKVIGGVAGYYFGGPQGAMAGYGLGSGIDAMGAQQSTNRQNIALAREQMAFQERMRDTQYQSAVKDMQAAGLNPMLAYMQGGNASPSGAMTTIDNVQAAGQSSASQAFQSAAALTAMRQSQAQTALIDASAAKVRSETIDQAVNTAQAVATLNQTGASTNLTRAQTASAEESARLINLQGWGQAKSNELAQLRLDAEEAAGKATTFASDVAQRKADAATATYETARARAESEFYKGIGQYNPYLRMILSVLSGASGASRVLLS